MGPKGDSILHNDHSKPAVFLSGGMGVIPSRSMIKYATDNQLPVKIRMFDSNRNEQNILYTKMNLINGPTKTMTLKSFIHSQKRLLM